MRQKSQDSSARFGMTRSRAPEGLFCVILIRLAQDDNGKRGLRLWGPSSYRRRKPYFGFAFAQDDKWQLGEEIKFFTIGNIILQMLILCGKIDILHILSKIVLGA
jgi:hypothetical protein